MTCLSFIYLKTIAVNTGYKLLDLFHISDFVYDYVHYSAIRIYINVVPGIQ